MSLLFCALLCALASPASAAATATLWSPANGATVTTATPTFAGLSTGYDPSGGGGGGEPTVVVEVYAGSTVSGTAARTLTTSNGGSENFSVALPTSEALLAGAYTARALHEGVWSPATTFTVAPASVSVVFDQAPMSGTYLPKTTVDLRFHAVYTATNEPVAAPVQFKCKVDDHAWEACTTTAATTRTAAAIWRGVRDGVHNFCVKESSPSGVPSCRSYTTAGEVKAHDITQGSVTHAGSAHLVQSAHAYKSTDINNVSDVYLIGQALGNRGAQLLSASAAGVPGNGASDSAVMNSSGTLVVFRSAASNLVSGDTNNASDIFLRDVFENTITRVSVSATGAQLTGTNPGYSAAISDADKFIAFSSGAAICITGKGCGVAGKPNVYIYDIAQAKTVDIASVSSSEATATYPSTVDWNELGLSVSLDARYVAFASRATNLVSGDTNGAADVFRRDRTGGTTARASVSSTGAQGGSANASVRPSMSADGRFIAFQTTAAWSSTYRNCAGTTVSDNDTNNVNDVYRRDMSGGTNSTFRISRLEGYTDPVYCNVQLPNNSASVSEKPAISEDGQFIAYETTGFYDTIQPVMNLNDHNGARDIVQAVVIPSTTETYATRYISFRFEGLNIEPFVPADGSSTNARMSRTGRYVAYDTTATNDTDNPADADVGKVDNRVHVWDAAIVIGDCRSRGGVPWWVPVAAAGAGAGSATGLANNGIEVFANWGSDAEDADDMPASEWAREALRVCLMNAWLTARAVAIHSDLWYRCMDQIGSNGDPPTQEGCNRALTEWKYKVLEHETCKCRAIAFEMQPDLLPTLCPTPKSEYDWIPDYDSGPGYP